MTANAWTISYVGKPNQPLVFYVAGGAFGYIPLDLIILVVGNIMANAAGIV